MKYCSDKSDVPAGPHFAIVEFSSITIPGDERSRQCPGHGYPESTKSVAKYIAFTDRAEWELEIAKRYKLKYTGSNFVALEIYKVAQVKVTLTVE